MNTIMKYNKLFENFNDEVHYTINKVGGLRVRQTESVGKVGNKMATKATTIGIYTGKKMVESGFKTKESAIVRAKEIQSQIVK